MDLSDITLDDIFVPETGHGVLVDLGLYDIGLLMSGAPIILPTSANGETIYQDNTGLCDTRGCIDKALSSEEGSSGEDLLSAACKAADISGAGSDKPTAPIPSPPSPRVQSPGPQRPQGPVSPIPSLMSSGIPSESYERDSSSPFSIDSGYSSFSSGGDPSSPRSDPDFPMPVSPTPSCFDEPMPEEDVPQKPSRPGPVPVKKPTDNYIALIGKAILSAAGRRMILADIINYILQEFPYYRTAPATWKTAIRHNLSVNDCFVKNGKADSGRGYYWSIHRACLDTFLKGDFRRSNARRLVQLMEKAKATAMQSGIAARNNGQSVMATSMMIGGRLAGDVMNTHLNHTSSYSGQHSSTALPRSSTCQPPVPSCGGHPVNPHTVSQAAWSTQHTTYYANRQSRAHPIYEDRATNYPINTTWSGLYSSGDSNGYYQNYSSGLYN